MNIDKFFEHTLFKLGLCKICQLTLFIILCFFCNTNIVAQQAKTTLEGLTLKSIWVDYNTNNNLTITKDFTSAIEIGYIKQINELFRFALPLRIGRSNVPIYDKTYKSKNFISGDVMVQLGNFKPKTWISPYSTFGLGSNIENLNNVSFSANIGIGMNIRILKSFLFNTQFDVRVPSSSDKEHFHIGLGFLYTFNLKTKKTDKELLAKALITPDLIDSDYDGVPNADDKCPYERGLLELYGCPDGDGDGVADKDDHCPEVFGFLSLFGCPDKDEDGIADKEDQCPDEKGIAANFGCPVEDTDEDGIPDKDDDCPNAVGKMELKGCPDRDDDGILDKDDLCPNVFGVKALQGCPDSDGDGIEDSKDKCPKAWGTVANNGCPELKKEEIEIIQIAEGVKFEHAKAVLLPASKTVLESIASIMKRHPYYHLRISGHTDNVGSKRINLRLSESRAIACLNYLKDLGIEIERMTSQGYGSELPEADNNTVQGREKNRRVDFKFWIK